MVGASIILTDRVVSYLTILDDDGTPSFIRMLDSRIDDGIPFALSAAENGFFASGAKYFGTGVDTFAAWTAKLSTTDGEPIWENTYLRGTTFTDMVSFPDEGFAACGIYWVNGWVIRADDDGDTTFSEVKEKIDIPAKINISISPNPFNSACKITAPANAEITIHDLRGNTVFKTNCPTKTTSNTEKIREIVWKPDKNVPSGIYIVNIMVKNELAISRRIVFLK